MNDIFDINQLPDRRLSIRKMIALHDHINVGDAIQFVQRDMARQLSIKILEKEPFFWKRGDKVAPIC